MLVLVIEVTDARQKASELRPESTGKGGQHPIRFFDFDAIVRRERQNQVGVVLVVDIGAESQLRLGDAESALGWRDVAARYEAVDYIFVGILREVGIDTLQHRIDGRIEGAGRSRFGGNRRSVLRWPRPVPQFFRTVVIMV